MAGEILDDERLIARGKAIIKEIYPYFSSGLLLFGEGHPQDGITSKGCRAIDLGYNVEESLPALALYGLHTGDEEVLQIVTESLRAHLAFMLPDGAWDNSWGTRSFKWTYWGSRTSDGCQAAYALLADRDPRFAEAALRNTILLQSCTHEGMLYGGPHNYGRGELPCSQHTLFHAKAIAALLDRENQREATAEKGTDTKILLPREEAVGTTYYPEISTWLTSIGSWRSTITAYDWVYFNEGHPSGGSLSMLWHEKAGPVLCASMTAYVMYEGTNMQRNRDPISIPLTPRLETILGGEVFSSVYDYSAAVHCKDNNEVISHLAEGRLVNNKNMDPDSGDVQYAIAYEHRSESITIRIQATASNSGSKLRYYLPIISPGTDACRQPLVTEVDIYRENLRISVRASKPIHRLECDRERVFHHVPGFEAMPLYVEFEESDKVEFMIRVEHLGQYHTTFNVPYSGDKAII